MLNTAPTAAIVGFIYYIYVFILLLLHPHDYPIKSPYIIYIYNIRYHTNWWEYIMKNILTIPGPEISWNLWWNPGYTPHTLPSTAMFFPVSVWSLRVWQWVPVASPGRSAVFLSKKFMGILAMLNRDVPSGKHTKSYWKLPFIADLPIKNGDVQ